MKALVYHGPGKKSRLVDTVSTPMLMKTVQTGKLNSKQLITHRFKLSEIFRAYDCFANAVHEKTLKVDQRNKKKIRNEMMSVVCIYDFTKF